MSNPIEERVRRFERLGGIRLDPADHGLLAAVRTGVAETHHGFRFRCPMCGNEAVNDQEMAPACTGPSWTDDHAPEPMVLVR